MLTILTLCASMAMPAPAAAQDTWLLFEKERPRRPAPVEDPGARDGDRPLTPRGGGYNAGPTGADRRYEAPPGGQRGAAPIAVERQELAPLPEPPPAPPLEASRGPPGASAFPPPAPASQWDTRTAPADTYAPPPPMRERQRGYAPPSRGPGPSSAAPFGAERAPGRYPPPPAPRDAARPTVDGLAELAPKALEEILDGVALPPKSAALAALWPEPWRAARGAVSPAFEAIRIESLRRAGAVEPLRDILTAVPPPTEPVLAVVILRAHLLAGQREAGCTLAGEAIRNRKTLPASFRRDAVLAAGYCALAGGNAEAGKLTADLIRGEGLEATFALAVLEGAGAGGKAPPPLPSSIGVLDYRIGEVAGVVWPAALVDRAEPAVLAVVAAAPTIDPGLRLAAAERAAQLHLLSPEALAAQYRDVRAGPGTTDARLAGPLGRAALLQAIEGEPAPHRKIRLMADLLEDARKAGLRGPVAHMLAPTLERVRPGPESAWFAASAAEILVRAGSGRHVASWADLARGLDHWRVLGALASDSAAPGPNVLAALEHLARAGRIDAATLHRVVTVLDALDVQIPIPLWEAASRTPQPTTGHLPPTGVLAALKQASDKGEGGQAIIRAAQAMGPASAADANLLTLGDVIRALRAVGFRREARALAVEALVDAWPTAEDR